MSSKYCKDSVGESVGDSFLAGAPELVFQWGIILLLQDKIYN